MAIGGAEQVISYLVRSTNSSKYEASILCLDSPVGDFGLKLREQGFHVHSFNRRPGLDISLIRNLRRYLSKHKINILHCHQYTPFVYGTLSSAFSKTRVVFTEHGRFYPDRRKFKRMVFNPILCRLASHLTAISSATCRALVQYENFPAKRLKVVYNGVETPKGMIRRNPELLTRYNIPEDAKILGTVARLDPIKNHSMMLKAFRQVLTKNPNCRLLIVGDGPERSNLEAQIQELEIKNKAILTGFQSETGRFYGLFDIFLLSSESEGTAMTLLESMAASIPSIVTDVGGNPEIVKDNITGFLTPQGDASKMAERISFLLENPDIACKMGMAAQARFEEIFSVRAMVSAYERFYNELS
jgi:glycosyltransferase involved in cell wall biosynthesis